MGTVAVGVLLLAGCSTAAAPAAPVPPTASTSPDIPRLAGNLVQRSIAPPPTMRLAEGLLPPTNKWFSGLVFGETAQPVFPFPIRYAPTDGGFSASLPGTEDSANAVLATAGSPVTVDLGATSALVSRYDEVSVTLEYRDGDAVLGYTTLAEGSPLVSYRAEGAQDVTLGTAIDSAGDGRGTVTVGADTWAVVTTSGTIDGKTVALDAGGTLVLFPVPDGADENALMASAAPLASVTTAFAATDKGQETTLTYVTESGDPTLVVPLPHQSGAATCGETAFVTIYGDVPLCDTGVLRFTTPDRSASAELDLSGITDAERAELTAQLKKDVAATETFAADTYFGGKSLYRASMLLQLARQLGDEESVSSLTADLTAAFDRWTQPDGCAERAQECFVVDPALGTVVGLAPSFGSEEGNDHVFHYGYFLYAAAVVAQEDPSLAERWAPVLDVLAADIATAPGTDTGFPALRGFDPYFSHAWASGYSSFADGNNQESSSEAVTAWAGLSLWAGVTGNAEMSKLADWLLSGETASALAYWVNPDLSGQQFAAFENDLVSINWGGKRDFATWFSPEPSAVIGIQLVPMSPSSGYLGTAAAGGAEQIGRLVEAAAPNGYDVMFGDFLLMYRSLAGGEEARAALAEARKLPDERIDGGDSRTYLLAYILSNTSRG